jgi:hypothetical protein
MNNTQKGQSFLTSALERLAISGEIEKQLFRRRHDAVFMLVWYRLKNAEARISELEAQLAKAQDGTSRGGSQQ